MNKRIEEIRRVAEDVLACSVHKMDHVKRVYNLCLSLSRDEDVDLEVLEAAALLHDIARDKEDSDPSAKIDHAVLGAEMAYPILKDIGFGEEKIKHIQDCIISHRYRTANKPQTLEAKILFDADKLDALGAVGIARGYMWAGKHGCALYKKPSNLQEYIDDNLGGDSRGRIKKKKKHSVQINFELKERHLADRMYTSKGKEVALERIEYMTNFLDRLEKEVRGETF